jgi:hypothetical protein
MGLTPAEYPTLGHRFNSIALLDRVGGLPGVVSAGLTTFLPYTEPTALPHRASRTGRISEASPPSICEPSLPAIFRR